MSSFKDFISNDLDTFVNTDEFAVDISIEGENVSVVLDDETMIERQLAKPIEGALHKEELFFYLKVSALTFYPRPDNIVIFDKVHWRIVDVQEDMGLFTVTCERMSA